ncbi:DNA polymerase I [Candidatus Saccharibacteria bacterium]|nr:DNA polymerase I [Candidatus Saccharibacteria bacterium]
MTKRKKLVIFDGHALVHRGYHAIPYLNTKDGTPTNAVYGFTMMMLLALRELKPDYVAVAWDAPGKTFRHDDFKEYKATRKKADQELYDQLPITKEVISAFNIPLLEQSGFEADDIIGSLSKQYEDKVDVVIVTGDMDELQLVSDKTTVFTMRKGFSDTFIYDKKAVHDKYGVTPEEFIVYKALKGDTSDNIPGVAGVGDKTATDLVSKYQTLDNIYKHLADLKPAVRNKMEAGKDSAYLSEKLSTIKRDMKLDFDLKDSVVHEYDRKKVYDLFHKLEFRTLLSKLPAEKITDEQTELSQDSEQKIATKYNRTHLKSVKYHLITNLAELKDLSKKLKAQKLISFDTETDSVDEVEANLVGASFSFKEGEAYYVPLAHDELTEIGYEEFIDLIGPILTDKSIGKIGHNIKYDYVVMKQFGIDVAPIAFDTMVAAFLISPIGRAQTLSQLAYEELGISMIDIEELIGKKGKNQLTFNKIAIKEAGQYAAEDADITLRLYNKLKSELDKIGELTKLAEQMEWPLIEVLGDMEYKGVELDVEFLNKLSDKYSAIIEDLQKKIWKIAGGQFNISSPAQLQKILFEKLNIDSTGLKKTKTGISTAASELEKLRGKHEIVDMMFEYRELTKLTTTYVDALPKLVKPDGRIHTSYNQTIAQTGRLSSTNPNLQNIPTRTEAGREIRKAFVAPKGRVFISADYSQIELRLAAALAKDEPMIKAFKSGADIHTATAAEMFGVKQSEVTKDQRYGAKTINFGVLYGMNPHGLSVATGFDYDKAREFIDRYFSLRKGVADYIASVKKFAHDNNYTETIFGRRRPCPDVRSSNFIIRAAAERAAVNMPLQGTAADMMKIAMINIHKKLPKDADLILQIHDELIVECNQEDAKKVEKIVKDEMEKVHKFDVPIEVEVHHGTSWGSLK